MVVLVGHGEEWGTVCIVGVQFLVAEVIEGGDRDGVPLVAEQFQIGSHTGIHAVFESSFLQTVSVVSFPIVVCVCGSIDVCCDAEFLAWVAQLGMDEEDACHADQCCK